MVASRSAMVLNLFSGTLGQLKVLTATLRGSAVVGQMRTCHDAPNFLYAAPGTTGCAVFIKESRMKFANATQLHRKSGGAEDE
jgi:hypothetical protein